MNNDSIVHIALLTGEPYEVAELQSVLDRTPGYFERVSGAPAGPSGAQDIFTALPKSRAYEDKSVFAIVQGKTMVGCIDLIRSYPTPATANLGLLLVQEDVQGSGIGSAAYHCVEGVVRSWPECERIIGGVVRTNDAVLDLWWKMGFVETGKVWPWSCDSVKSEVVELSKVL